MFFKRIIANISLFAFSVFWRLIYRGADKCCPICGCKVNRFMPAKNHANRICPKCKSEARHRIFAALESGRIEEGRINASLKDKVVLHFAPEKCLDKFIKTRAKEYNTADVIPGKADLVLDMTNMPQVKSSVYDVVIAFDVLEHIRDDTAAINELHRIIKPDGFLIFSVPIQRAKTKEYTSIPETGDPDHVRSCGEDYCDRFARHQFEVLGISAKGSSREYSLFDLGASEHHSKIYFARPVET